MGRSGKSKQRNEVADDPRKTRPHDWQKDEEEIDLEAKLFGTSRVTKGKSSVLPEDEAADGHFGDLDDEDLFEVDAPVAEMPSEDEGEDETQEIDFEVDLEDKGADKSEEGSEDQSDVESTASSSSGSGASVAFDMTADRVPQSALGKKRKGGEEDLEPEIEFPEDMEDELPASRKGKGKATAVWEDPSDELVRVDLEAHRLLKKLGRGKGDPNVSGSELEKRLREQFETLHPRPEWASRRVTAGTPSLRLLLSSTKSFITPQSHAPLPSGNLELQRVLNANHQNPTVGRRAASGAGKGVVDVSWHPNPKVGVMAVSGGDRRVRFFNIDGHTNPTLLTIHLPSLPLTKSTFHPSGSSLLLAGTRPYYYTYDLPSARCIRSPRNLFGSTITPSTPNSLTRHAFSPDGSMLAVAGRRGAVSILDWSGVGVGAVIAELRSGRGGAVVAMTWSLDSKELSVLGGRDGAEVEVWDVPERQVVRKWKDDRAFGGTTMEMSRDGEYTAIGSSTGIVNLYSAASLSTRTPDASQHILPEPMKSLEHLTTPIVSTAFHPRTEMLLTASNTKKNQLKTYHLPTGSAFANWPTKTTPLGRVTNVSFAPSGEYLAAGNERGIVLLYNIKHYSRS